VLQGKDHKHLALPLAAHDYALGKVLPQADVMSCKVPLNDKPHITNVYPLLPLVNIIPSPIAANDLQAVISNH
jgi:hypothetical protein